uniref:Cytochrome P450 3A9 n=1 Tax=Aceria tosichella TaxID=561515 RepID=A0A6G1SMP5_9ACAR
MDPSTTTTISQTPVPVQFFSLQTIVVRLLGLIAIICLVKFYLLIRQRRNAIEQFKRKCTIPLVGEPGLFGGNFLEMIAKPNNCQLIHDYHLKLGDTYGLFYGPDPWVMTVDLELIQRVFITEGSTHINVTQFRLPFVREINESLAQVSGDKWRTIRRIMGPSFAPKSMKSDNVYRDIDSVCDMFINMLETQQAIEDLMLLTQQRQEQQKPLDTSSHSMTMMKEDPVPVSNQQGVELDVCHEFKRYSLEVIFRVAFGLERSKELEPQARDEIIDWLDEAARMVNGPLVHIGVMLGIGARLLGFFSQFTPLGACISHIHSIIETNLQRRRRRLMKQQADDCIKGNKDSNSSRKLIDSLIERFDLGEMDDETFKANLFFILLAGHETSANTLAMMFWLLANHPGIQDKLRHLIASEGDQAEYLNWVIWETLRLYPAVPAAIGRVLEHDIEHHHGGVVFPKGSTIIASIWSLHRWQKYWGADVSSFRPERFGEPNSGGGQWSSLRFFAFGDGPRYCIGKHLAMAEIKAIASRLLVKYRVSLCANSPPPTPTHEGGGEGIKTISPNLIHFIIEHPIKLAFTKITNL